MPKDVPVRTAYSLLPRYVPRQKFQVDKAWSGLGVLNGWIFTDWRWRYFYSYKWLWTNSWLGSNPFLRHKRQIFVLRSGWKSLGKLFQSSLLPPASWLRVWNKETFILSAFYGKLLLQILVSLYIFIFFSCFLFFQSRTGNPLTRPTSSDLSTKMFNQEA